MGNGVWFRSCTLRYRVQGFLNRLKPVKCFTNTTIARKSEFSVIPGCGTSVLILAKLFPIAIHMRESSPKAPSGARTYKGFKMRRIEFPEVLKLLSVLGAAARRPRYFVRVFSVSALLLFASATYAQNTISTVAGGPPLNNVSPTAAPLVGPQAVVRDGSGNLYVVNDNGVIYKVVNQPGVPSTMVILAGNNTAGFSPDGTAATATLTFEPYGAAVDANGNLYYSDSRNCVVREVAGGVVKTVAGNGNCGFSGDNGQATSASLNFVQGIALDGLGNLFIADAGNAVVRRVVLGTGIIATYAGTPDAQGFPTSGAAATSTPLGFPAGVAADANGDLFIADENDNVICRVDATSKILTIVAGTGGFGFSGDGGPATSATMQAPDGVAVDSTGNIYISDAENAVIREVFSPTNPNAPNQINTIVGNTTFGFSGDGGPALSAELTNPAGLFVDSTTGNLWIADFWANRIRLYSPGNNKQITTVVGSGAVGDDAPATSASFYFPRTPQLDSQGNLYIVDAENNRIRKMDTSGNISTVVGTGIPCAQPHFSCGDGGPAASALIFMPRTVTIEANGDLLVSDDGDNRIREVSGGNINTIVGSGGQCGSGQGQVPLPCGDGGPALQASVNDARGAVRDAAGNLYFVDAQDNRVREVDTGGTITSIAGGGANDSAPTGCGNGGYTGDNGPAVNSTLNCPLGLDIDAQGNLYIADTDNDVIRKIDTGTPRIITTIAGNGTPGNTGDGSLATSATLNSPDRVSVNGAGNFFISDSGNNRIRRVDGTSKIITKFAGNGTFAFAGDNGPALSASFATPVGVVVTPEGNMYVGDLFNNRIRKVTLNSNVTLSSNTAGFANQTIDVSATLPVTVTNSGDAPLMISNIALTGASVFSLATSTSPCPVTPAALAVGANCVIEVAFMPTQFVASTGTITITDNAPVTTQTINVSGTGAAALTVQVTGTGSVTSSPAGITACTTSCTATFTGNSQVALTAAPGTNFTFGGFTTNCTPTNVLSCTVTMSAAETVAATFVPSGGGGGGLTIGPTTLPNGAVGSAYGQILVAGGGIAPFNFSISSGALPAGLTIGATTGSIAGVPTGAAGTATFTVKVTDSSSTPLTGSANFTITIAAADSTNNSELNGSYAFLFQGFNDSDGTMVVVAGSFVADGHGNILPGGFEDADGSTGAQPTQELSGGSYTIGADNRGSMSLTTTSGTTVLAISVGNIQGGVATKARFIRFDDLSGTNGQTGSGVMLKQDPSIFALAAIKGSYAFGESGSKVNNGNPESGVGFLNADGNGNFTPAGLVDLNDGGGTGPSLPLSGTYALTSHTVSSGRLTASVSVTDVTGTVSDVIYIVSSSQFIFISINTTKNTVYSGIAQLQVPPATGFDSTSLSNSVVAMQGKQANGSPIALIGSLTTNGNGNFTLSYIQNSSGTSTTATAGGTYVVGSNGRAELTFTSGGFSPTIIYLDGPNQGFAAASDANASSGPLDPGLLTYSNTTLSATDNFFFGTVAPTTINNSNQSGVASFGATTVQSVSDATAPGGILLGDAANSQTYNVGQNGQLNFSGQGVVGFVANDCKIEVLSNASTNQGIETAECQQTPTSGSTVTLAPTSLTFSSQTVGTTSAPQGVTVTNTGTGTVTFTGFTVTGANSADFGVPLPNSPAMCNPLQGTLAAGASCTINVLFTPTATGTRTATLNIADGAAGSPQTVTLTGTGGSSPVASLGITKTHTGNFTQGQQGATYTITVSNGAGAGPTSGIVTVTDTIPSGLTLVSLAGTGWTCVAASCTRSDALAGGASYPVITVTVNVAGNAAASVTNSVSVSGGGSATASTTNPTTITTTGGGGGSGIATVTPSSLAFGGVQVGNSSALSFTLQNTGTGPLGNIAISVVTVTDSSFPAEPAPVLPDYAITSNTCPTNLAVGSAACTVTVTFAPTFQAADPGSVVITDDSSAGPTTVLLSGTGAGPLFVLPFEIFYDGITPGTKSPAQTATLFNATDSEVSVTGVTFVGNAAADFSVASNGCGDGVGTSCPIGVAFTPSTTVLGPRTADLTIATNSEGTPTVVSHLTGNGAIRHLPGFTANVLPPNDDGSSSQINLPFTMNFFGESFTSLFVNNNGNVTFGTALAEFTPNGLNTNNGGIPIIAPFWADVDTSAAAPDSQDAGSPPSGVVTFGVDTVNGHQAFGVNYENVGFFSFHSDKLNSFQLVLIDRSDTGIAGAFDMEFNYDKIQWEAGDASDGNDGLCTIASECAAVGYSNGTGNAGTNFQLAGSFTIGALLDNGPAATSLIHNSLNNPMIGRYLFQVRNGTVQGADLGLAMTQSANTVAAGSNQTYTLNVTNAGPSDATNTTVSDTLPTNATLVSATGSQGAACAGTTVVTCNLGTVANAGAATVTIVVTVNAGATGTVVNTATVVSDLPDPNQPNNTASVTATIGTSTNVTLTIVETGSGMGTVSSVPAGINCPATTCSASFASGTVVALTALPSDGSTFAGWSGGGCTGTGGCSVTMTVAQTVTATFNSGNSPVTIGLAPGSPSTVATTPGSSAVFGLTLTSLPGITGTVTLGCTSTSPNITCNLVPSSITLTGKAINVAIVVNTFCKADVPAFGPSLPGGLPGGLALLLASMSLCGAVFTFKRRPRLALSFGVLLLIAVGMSACSNLPKSPGGQATKPGLYPLVVTATAPNGAVSSVNLTLNVLP